MIDQGIVRTSIQRALDILATSKDWDDMAAIRCHLIGLQGEKRRLRYLSRKAGYIITFLQHKPLDIFEPPLSCLPIAGDVGDSIAKLTDAKVAMPLIVEKLWKIYTSLHQIANELVANNMRPLADCLYEYIGCIFNVIGDLNRADREYKLADYEYHHISRYQVGWANVHDEYEDKEESQGYSDCR